MSLTKKTLENKFTWFLSVEIPLLKWYSPLLSKFNEVNFLDQKIFLEADYSSICFKGSWLAHLVMPRDTFGLPASMPPRWVETMNTVKYLNAPDNLHLPHPTKNYLVQDISNGEVEKPWSTSFDCCEDSMRQW